LRRGADDDLADVDVRRLLGRERDGAGDGVRSIANSSRGSLSSARRLYFVDVDVIGTLCNKVC
jgi:hypothetical protein